MLGDLNVKGDSGAAKRELLLAPPCWLLPTGAHPCHLHSGFSMSGAPLSARDLLPSALSPRDPIAVEQRHADADVNLSAGHLCELLLPSIAIPIFAALHSTLAASQAHNT